MMRITHDIDRRHLDYPRGRHRRTCSRWLPRAESSVGALMTYLNTLNLFPDAIIRADLTRNGFHVISHIPGLPQSRASEFRAILGDDERRLDRTERGRKVAYDNIMSTTKLGRKQYVVKGIQLI